MKYIISLLYLYKTIIIQGNVYQRWYDYKKAVEWHQRLGNSTLFDFAIIRKPSARPPFCGVKRSNDITCAFYLFEISHARVLSVETSSLCSNLKMLSPAR